VQLQGKIVSNDSTTQDAASAETTGDAVGVAHVIGVSLPEDEYRRRGDDDVRTREELEALGVEPDARPTWMFAGVFAGLVAVVAISGVAMIQLFYYSAEKGLLERSHSAVDPRLAEVRSAAQAVLGATETREGEGGTEYRFPVQQAMRVVAARPELLAGHPLGGEAVEPPAQQGGMQVIPALVPARIEPVVVPTLGINVPSDPEAADTDAPSQADTAADGEGDTIAADGEAVDAVAPAETDAPTADDDGTGEDSDEL
jgi:hypothetical protein